MTLADRIVIMRDGLIEQLGTPDEVFHQPATRFVGGFIGSPTMNIADAIVADGRIVFPGGDWLPIPARFKGAPPRSPDRARNAPGRAAFVAHLIRHRTNGCRPE